jgi:DNA-binding MarR family transcriptional regulator
MIRSLALAGRQMSAATIMFHQAVADHLGLHATDHKCLDLLHIKGPLTAGQVADFTGLTTGAVTGVIDRLEEAGFVQREPDSSDRRKVIVRALPDRCAELAKMFEPLRQRMAELCSHFTDEQLATILTFQGRTQQVLHEATLELRRQSEGAKK